MKCPVVITPEGKLTSKATASLGALFKQIDSWSLTPTRYIMNERDFQDIVKWGSGK